MPSSPNYIRNFKQEYSTSQSSSKEKKRRAGRNKARRLLTKLGRVRKGDQKDVDHKDFNTNQNRLGNLRVQNRSKNRSFKRNKNAERK